MRDIILSSGEHEVQTWSWEYLHHGFGAGHLQHLPAPLGAIRQREMDDLCVPRELQEQNISAWRC